jgi:hypothetical protein
MVRGRRLLVMVGSGGDSFVDRFPGGGWVEELAAQVLEGAAAGPGPTVDGTDLRHEFMRQPVVALGAGAPPRRPRPARATRTRGGREG